MASHVITTPDSVLGLKRFHLACQVLQLPSFFEHHVNERSQGVHDRGGTAGRGSSLGCRSLADYARHTPAAQQGRRPGTRPLPPYRISTLTRCPSLSSQWIIVDSKVYDLSRFAKLHPGGRAVLVDAAVAGQDATEAFYGLHRHEVLERPQYARLQIGILQGEKSVITGRLVGGLSAVPYAEPTYLSKGFHSPYYTEVRVCRVPPARSVLPADDLVLPLFFVGALIGRPELVVGVGWPL